MPLSPAEPRLRDVKSVVGLINLCDIYWLKIHWHKNIWFLFLNWWKGKIKLIFLTFFYWSWIANNQIWKNIIHLNLLCVHGNLWWLYYFYTLQYFVVKLNFMHLILFLFCFLFCWKGEEMGIYVFEVNISSSWWMFSLSWNVEWQVKFASENPRTRVFSDDILLRYAGLKGAKIWKEEHDLVLLHAVLKYVF